VMPRQARLFPSATIARFDTHCLRSLLADQYKCSRSNFRIPHREAIKYRLDGSPLIGPEKRRKKAIRTARCLSDSEFRAVPLFSEHRRNRPIVADTFGLLLVTFLGEARKVTAPRHEREGGEAPMFTPPTLRRAQGERGGQAAVLRSTLPLTPGLRRGRL
jgi:hypothetical protein